MKDAEHPQTLTVKPSFRHGGYVRLVIGRKSYEVSTEKLRAAIDSAEFSQQFLFPTMEADDGTDKPGTLCIV